MQDLQWDRNSDCDSPKGTVLGQRYRLGDKIATGGMSVVYAGTRVKLGRAVAIKFLHPSLSKKAQFLKRFEREARAASQLSHPNCVPIIDFGVTHPPYLVMDLVDGITLEEMIEKGPLEPRSALLILRQLLSGLAHAHLKGIIHRDIKPKNIMISKTQCSGDYVRILDFGLAKIIDENGENITGKSMIAGTFDYIAPEYISRKDKSWKIDQRTDIFSAGVVAYQMLTGMKPFFARFPTDILHMHERPPLPLGKANPKGVFSPQLERLVAKALVIDPNERYQTAAEFVEALDSVLQMEQAWSPAVIASCSALCENPAMDKGDAKAKARSKWWLPLFVVSIVAFDFFGWMNIWQTNFSFVSEPEESPVVIETDEQRSPLASVTIDSAIHIRPRNRQDEAPSEQQPATDQMPKEQESITGGEAEPLPSEVDQTEGDHPQKEYQDALSSPGAEGEQVPRDALSSSGAEGEQVPQSEISEAASMERTAKKDAPGEMAAVLYFIRTKRTEQAIEKLDGLTERFPGDGYLHFLLGNLYSDQKLAGKALDAYGRAIELQPKLGSHNILIANIVGCLADDDLHAQASAIIEQKIGEGARFQLKRALNGAFGIKARSRARDILQKWNRRTSR